jgi:hypothetical protein
MSVPRRNLSWHRSTRCADRTCVEVATDDDGVYLRGAGVLETAVLRFTRSEWDAFRDGVKRGDFDVI